MPWSCLIRQGSVGYPRRSRHTHTNTLCTASVSQVLCRANQRIAGPEAPPVILPHQVLLISPLKPAGACICCVCLAARDLLLMRAAACEESDQCTECHLSVYIFIFAGAGKTFGSLSYLRDLLTKKNHLMKRHPLFSNQSIKHLYLK